MRPIRRHESGLGSSRVTRFFVRHTLFATASVAKTITAVAVLQLVEEGRITLDQPARAIVPLEGSAIGADVCVHHLLTHTSGIGDHLPEDDGAGPVGTGQVPAPRTRGVADLLPLFVDLPPRFPAGARYASHHPDAAINVVVLSNVDAGAVDLYRQISAMLADGGM